MVVGMEAFTKLMTAVGTMLILSIGGGYFLACNKQRGGLLAFAASNQNIFS
jgi:hypothetical protein